MTTEREREEETLADLLDCVQALRIYQRALRSLASPDELEDAEGKRCILAVTGMKHHPDYRFFFEVNGASIKLVEPYREYTTYIEAPLDAVLRVLKGVLNGDPYSFSKERVRGKARIVGQRSVHDTLAFHEAFRRLANLIKRYRGAK